MVGGGSIEELGCGLGRWPDIPIGDFEILDEEFRLSRDFGCPCFSRVGRGCSFSAFKSLLSLQKSKVAAVFFGMSAFGGQSRILIVDLLQKNLVSFDL